MDSTSILPYIDVLVVTVGLVLIRGILSSKKVPAPLPPGPRKLLLLGNVLDMPTGQEWLTFARWGKQYGELTSVSVFGQTLIIVNSAKVAIEMLDKKGSIYSDRPIMEMGGELVGWKNTLVLLPYGDRFRNTRRLAHKLFGSNATMHQFLPVEERETHRFLQRLLHSPSEFDTHIRKTAGAIILRISHGYEVREGEDPFVTLADQATEQFALSTAPGFLVNLIPALRHLPEWFPGGGFKRVARKWRRTLEEMVDRPYKFVKDGMAAGTAEVSFTSSLLQDEDLTPEDEFDLKWAAASLYSGGADTTVSAINSFLRAMVLFPEVQKAAQAEIDSVIGNDRLPGFKDQENLPYIRALVLEVVRFHSVVPTGVPHRVMEDNIHNGYFIPKGSLVISNIWQMSRDETVYKNPEKFDPSRFLRTADHEPEPDPTDLTFGFGRRICPGRKLALASIFIACAATLAVFNISKAKDANGIPVEPDLDQTTGTISHPTKFQAQIEPRSEKAIALIKESHH